MFKPSEFSGRYVIELHWVGDMKEATVRVKVTHKNVYKKYLNKLTRSYIVSDMGKPFPSSYPVKNIKGENNEHVRYIYCKKFVDAYRIIDYYKTYAQRLISMVSHAKQNAELGFDNLTYVNFGKEKINIDDYLQ